MHYVLVLWFQKVVKRHFRWKSEVIVYADDFICIFENKSNSEKFYKVLGKRLGKFGLKLSSEKTNIIDFRLVKKNSFDFLGFTFRWGKGRNKKLLIRTSKKNFNKSYKAFKTWLRVNKSMKKKLLFKKLNQKLRGNYNYYGIKGNSDGIGRFYRQVIKQLFKVLNSRSQKRSYNWEGFNKALEYFDIEKPRVIWSNF
jgi:RNA-directed DNA polymerase